MRQWHFLYQNPETAPSRKREPKAPAHEWSSQAEAKSRLFASLRRNIGDRRTLKAMEAVPREFFVPAEYFSHAYEDGPLPIGEGQTISQPLIVALMTQALGLQGHEKVLEVGAGSGYQAAVLARLARHVISVERKAGLLTSARRRLALLEIPNVELHQATDDIGWQPGAPYDAIIVSAGAPEIPRSLARQLADGGRMVVPTGGRQQQQLLKLTRQEDRLSIRGMGGCAFVPLIGNDAWGEDSV